MSPSLRQAEDHRCTPTPVTALSKAQAAKAQAAFTKAYRHHQARRWDAAERCYRQVLAIHPRHADSLHLLGVVAYRSGRDAAAIDLIRQAIAVNGAEASYHVNLGNALQRQGQLDQAASSFTRALALAPDLCGPRNNLGIVHLDQGRLDDAIGCFHAVLARQPDHLGAQVNLGNALHKQGRPDEAIACFRTVIGLRPDYLPAYVNLGMALTEQARPDEAISCFQTALRLDPTHPAAYNNLGDALQQQRRLVEAVACFQRAVALKPDYAEAHTNLAMVLLALGDLAAAWPEYEWRWQGAHLAASRRDFACPQWRGEPAPGRTLLIHAEQGFGDTLQFCRYAPLAAARGLRVVLEVPRALARLLRSLPGVDQVVAQGEARPGFDLHCPMLSLPLAFGTTVATIPTAPAYLHADPAQVAAWQARLAATGRGGPRVGLVWAGSTRADRPSLAAIDHRRSLPADRLAPLLAVPGVHFVSLQKDGPAAPPHAALTDFMPEMTDFADTAALIAALDLVISVDTAVAHLAAALGKPVWVMDRFDSCWRWLTGRRDSPWYPTLLLHRQPRPGDWDAVVAEIAANLRGLAAACTPQ